MMYASHVQADPPPNCRLDSSLATPIENAANRAINVYRSSGILLPFKTAKVAKAGGITPDVLRIEVVKDATQGSVDRNGCLRKGAMPMHDDQPLDSITVQGGCYVASDSDRVIRCSYAAILAFMGKNIDKPISKSMLLDITHEEPTASPGLIYVLAHEIGHIHQQRRGEFSGQIVTINLGQPASSKLKTLVSACDSKRIQQEKEADELALQVLRQTLHSRPYKQPGLSSRGAMYWNIDKINLAADTWVRIATHSKEELKINNAFIPTEFPTPREKVKDNARDFFCHVLTTTDGSVAFPLRATTHPAPEQRLRRIAEEIKPIADELPPDDGTGGIQPIAKLQNDLSPILSKIYIDTGIYMESLYSELCSLVNKETISDDCGYKTQQ